MGPGVPRIAPFHLGLNRRPRSLPEARKIARDLNRPVRRREQIQCERQLTVSDRRMLRQPKQLLHADLQGGCASRLVIDGMTIPRGRLEMRRSLFLQASFQIPWQQGVERGAEVIGADLGELRLTSEERGEPLRGRLGKRLIGQVRPFVLSVRAQETDPVAELDLRLASRQAAQSVFCNAVSQQTRSLLARHHRPGLVCEQDGVEPADTARLQRTCALIELDLVILADAMTGGGKNVRFIGCGCQQDARRRRRS